MTGPLECRSNSHAVARTASVSNAGQLAHTHGLNPLCLLAPTQLVLRCYMTFLHETTTATEAADILSNASFEAILKPMAN